MGFPQPEPELAVEYVLGKRKAAPLLAEARRLRDEGKGKTVTYSRKVFVPLTTMCRDTCTYCTFVKPPGAGGQYLVPEDVLAIARAGEAHACTEALFTLGDRPEAKWPQAQAFLDEQGCATTLDYVKVMTDSGPGTATETLTSYAGRIYFGNADFPYASTIALLTLVLVIMVSTLFMRIFKVKL